MTTAISKHLYVTLIKANINNADAVGKVRVDAKAGAWKGHSVTHCLKTTTGQIAYSNLVKRLEKMPYGEVAALWSNDKAVGSLFAEEMGRRH